MKLIDRAKEEYCQQCKFVDWHDWYVCAQAENEEELFIIEKDRWKTCKKYSFYENN